MRDAVGKMAPLALKVAKGEKIGAGISLGLVAVSLAGTAAIAVRK